MAGRNFCLTGPKPLPHTERNATVQRGIFTIRALGKPSTGTCADIPSYV